MKKTYIFILLFIVVLFIEPCNSLAQTGHAFLNFQANYIFNTDSLMGFEEEAAQKTALSEGYYGDEFKVRMYYYKRDFINTKYKLISNPSSFNSQTMDYGRAASCVNEDFEASTPGVLTSSNQITGWTITSGSNTTPNNACNPGGCCPNQPSACELIQCPATGYIDPEIGNCYPIFSVFGNTNNNGNTVNPLLPQMKGSNIIRINNNFPQSGIARLSKTINVTSSNALFQFAYISILSPGHPCCGSTAFFIKITNLTTNTILACPSATIYSPAPGCSSVSPSTLYYLADGTCNTNPSNNNNQSIFNKWSTGALDLTPYLGNNIKIDVTVTDCATGAHFGYAYFDAQCSPMDIVGNNILYPFSTPNIIITSCSPNSNTVIAPPDVGPYTWTSTAIPIPPNLAIPNHTNTTFISNQSGTVALIMTPPGICAPIVKVITLSVSTGPTASIQVTQPSCTNSTAVVSLTTSSTSSVSPSISWNPQGTVSSNSLTNTNPPTGAGNVTIQDSPGCFVVLNYTIDPSPSFAVVNSSTVVATKCGTNIGFISLDVIPLNTNFSWSPPVSTTYSANMLAAGVYTITLTTQNCVTHTQIAISILDLPIVLNTYTSASNCDSANGSATITATNSNNTYVWLPSVSSSSTALNLSAGIYTVTIGSATCGAQQIVIIPQAESPYLLDVITTDNLCKKNNGSIVISNVIGGTPPYFYALGNGTYSNVSSFNNLSQGTYLLKVKDAKGCVYNQNIVLKDSVIKSKLYYKINSMGECDDLNEIIIDSIVGGTKPYLISMNNSPLFYSDTIRGLTELQYVVKVVDSNTCETENLVINRISKSQPLVYIPNSFTPNGDGLNDFWFPLINCSFDYHCFIFDRWGILIKELKDVSEKWDGNYGGKELPIGIYNYIIDVTGYDRKAKRHTGHINLIK